MIVVDTSALMAILLEEPEADRCAAALGHDEPILISAGTFAEVIIVSARRGVGQGLIDLIASIDLAVVDVTADRARRIGEHYESWGKGFHPAALNYGDCFAYALAKERDCPLLYIGNDFARTDISSALS